VQPSILAIALFAVPLGSIAGCSASPSGDEVDSRESQGIIHLCPEIVIECVPPEARTCAIEDGCSVCSCRPSPEPVSDPCTAMTPDGTWDPSTTPLADFDSLTTAYASREACPSYLISVVNPGAMSATSTLLFARDNVRSPASGVQTCIGTQIHQRIFGHVPGVPGGLAEHWILATEKTDPTGGWYASANWCSTVSIDPPFPANSGYDRYLVAVDVSSPISEATPAVRTADVIMARGQQQEVEPYPPGP